MMNTPPLSEVDASKRLSQSKLWQYQQDFFDRQGIDAWAGSVPFYVTSNHHITHSYAESAFAFMVDYLENHPESQKETFYLVELGTGSGQFSFYVLQYLSACLQRYPATARPKFCYIMTDFTQNNLQFWTEHEALKPFVKQGLLDFAIFDMEKDSEIQLHQQKKVIKKGLVKNPMIVFANYIFDTVSNDAFRVQSGTIQELQVKLETDATNIREDGSINDLNRLKCQFSTQAINPSTYYEDRSINDILKYYQSNLNNTHVLIPIAGINTLKRLFEMSNNRLMLLSSDKAYSELSDIDYRDTPHIAFHGSFSLMVNYDAIVRYFHLNGGECTVPTPRQGLKTVLCLKGLKTEDMPRLKRAISQHIEGVSPSDYFTIYRYFMDTQSNLNIDQILAALSFTHWDPYVFNKLINRIMSILKDANETAKLRLKSMISTLDKNFYMLPGSQNTYFNLGICCYLMKDYGLALSYYDKAEKSHGGSANLSYNRGLCYHENSQKVKALEQFKLTLERDPNNKSAQEWIKKLS